MPNTSVGRGMTVSQLKVAIGNLPDDALVVVIDKNNDGARTITEFLVGAGYDPADKAARSLLIEIED